MKNHLKPKEKRHLEIIEYLLETEDWATTNELSDFFQISSRIVTSDIADLRKKFPEFIFETGYFGIRLIKSSQICFQNIYTQLFEDSIAFQLLETIFFDESMQIEELADTLFVSPSTIYRTITQINEYFETKYGLFVATNPYRFSTTNKLSVCFIKHTLLKNILCSVGPLRILMKIKSTRHLI